MQGAKINLKTFSNVKKGEEKQALACGMPLFCRFPMTFLTLLNVFKLIFARCNFVQCLTKNRQDVMILEKLIFNDAWDSVY
jgi:hypothetical protein